MVCLSADQREAIRGDVGVTQLLNRYDLSVMKCLLEMFYDQVLLREVLLA